MRDHKQGERDPVGTITEMSSAEERTRERPLDPSIHVGALFQDRYRILEKLSAGGYGIVFRAEQLSTRQTVALKFLRRRGLTDAEDRQLIHRFQREMELCAQLHHPNIVRLIDSGQTQNDEIYTVFEFVPGKNLAQVLVEEGRLGPIEAGRLMAQVLDALSCTHTLGIVHRDLKPANIMVVPTGARRNALVLDFGIGGVVEESRDAAYEPITGVAERIGTPSFSSPEQLRGKTLTPSSDIYSWGLVFIECLTGTPAIPGRSLAEVIHYQLDTAPVPLPPQLRDHPLERVLRLATEKDLVRRRVTARQLLAMLEQCDLESLELRFAGTNSPTPHAQAPASASAPEPLTDHDPAAPAHTRAAAGTAKALSHESVISSAERKQITVVSCELRVLSAGAAPLDFEEHEELFGQYAALCKDIARNHGCRFTDDVGNRVLLYYGYPRAHGGDATRAVRAALAIAQAFAGQGAGARGGRVDARLGVHTGLVIVEGRDGHTPPLGSSMTSRHATELDAAAAPSTVIISANTHLLVQDHFPCEPITGPDGAAADHGTMYRITGSHKGIGQTTPYRDGHALVGRTRELDELLLHWSQARDGNGRALLLLGDPGIGKSRLIRELRLRLHDQPARWLECRCTPDSRNSMLRPVVDMLAQHIGCQHDTADADRRRRIEEFLARHGFDATQVLPLVAPLFAVTMDMTPLAHSPQRQKELLLGALVSLILKIAAPEPLLFVIDDAQWADATTLELVSSLISEAPMAPVYVLVLARPEFRAPWHNATMSVLQLGRLHREHIAEMLDQTTGGKPVPAQVIDEIARRTDGVPLFVEELTRAVLESDALVEHAGRFVLRGSLANLDIPITLRDVLTARLDKLDHTAKATAQLAAVLGREFLHDQLEAVSPLSHDALDAALEELVETGLVFRRRRLNGATYLFKHALIRDAAYDSLPRRVRRRYHAHVARVLETRFPELADVRPELFAYHHADAGATATALDYIQRAALQALQRSAMAETRGYAEQAMTWLPALADARQRAAAELGLYALIFPSILGSGKMDRDYQSLFERAQGLVVEVEDSPHALSVLWGLWLCHYVQCDFAAALELGRQVLERGERAKQSLACLMGCSMIVSSLFYMGRFAEAREHVERGLSVYDPEMHGSLRLTLGHDLKVTLLSLYGTCAWIMGQVEHVDPVMETALQYAREIEHPLSACFPLLFQAHLALWRDELGAARQSAAAILDIAERHGFDLWLLLGKLLASAADRDPDAATEVQRGETIGESFWRASIAVSWAARGDLDCALEAIERALEHAESKGEVFYLAELYRLKAVYLHRKSQDPDQSEALLRRALSTARSQGARSYELRAAMALCTLLLGSERHAQAVEDLRVCYQAFTEGFDTPDLIKARALLA
jgi:TOMM system kinase/cyclase fusion protein